MQICHLCLKDYTTIKSKNCSSEKFLNLDLVLYVWYGILGFNVPLDTV